MTSLPFLAGRIETVPSASRKRHRGQRPKPLPADDAQLGFDLVSQLAYMTAISHSSVSRDVVFEETGQQGYKTAGPILQVYYLVKRVGIEYAIALQRVAKVTRSALMKSILLRFAAALSSGEAPQSFFEGEFQVEMERYQQGYERATESLRKWGDAYAALLVSATLIVVVAIISTMITDLGVQFTLMLAMVMLAITAIGAWLIYRCAPVEVSSYTSKHFAPPMVRWAYRLVWLVALPGVILGVAVGVTVGPGPGLVIGSLCLIPAGVLAWINDRRVAALDADVPSVVRAIGATASALGSTPTVALAKVDKRSTGKLEPYVRRLHGRLANHLRPKVCWERFAAESGSELVRRTFGAFVDAVSYGAPPSAVSSTCSRYALGVVLLRAKRQMAATTFATLVLPLHATMTALLLFILEIVMKFNTKIGEVITEVGDETFEAAAGAASALPYFQPKDMGELQLVTGLVIAVLTMANGLVPGFALGGHPLKALLFIGLAALISGINMVMVPLVSGRLIQM